MSQFDIPLVDIDVDDFISFINSVETLMALTRTRQPDPIELEKVRLAVTHDCAYFTSLIKEAQK